MSVVFFARFAPRFLVHLNHIYSQITLHSLAALLSVRPFTFFLITSSNMMSAVAFKAEETVLKTRNEYINA